MKIYKGKVESEELIDELYPIIELAISHILQEKKLNRTCRLKKDDTPVTTTFTKTFDVLGDFYRLHSIKNALVRYKKNVTIGRFLVYNDFLVYHHIYPQFRMMVAIREFLKDSGIDLKYVGNYIIFETDPKSLVVNEVIELYHKVYLIKLPYTQVANMYVASNRANRLFLLSNNYLYKESHSHPVILNESLYKEIKNNDIIHTYKDFLAMLVNAKYSHTTIQDVEQYYSELLVKNLTK